MSRLIQGTWPTIPVKITNVATLQICVLTAIWLCGPHSLVPNRRCARPEGLNGMGFRCSDASGGTVVYKSPCASLSSSSWGLEVQSHPIGSSSVQVTDVETDLVAVRLSAKSRIVNWLEIWPNGFSCVWRDLEKLIKQRKKGFNKNLAHS